MVYEFTFNFKSHHKIKQAHYTLVYTRVDYTVEKRMYFATWGFFRSSDKIIVIGILSFSIVKRF